MIIPLGTDRPRRRKPRATGVIIVLNMLTYLVSLILDAVGTSEMQATMISLGTSRAAVADGSVWTLLTYQFAHSPNDVFHLAFNMLGLWIFGSSLEDRMGHLNFVAFYLMGGVVAGLAHTLVSAGPVIGASGAVCAATGGFLVLFPRAQVKILVIFLLIGIYMIPATWIVAFFVFFDMLGILKPAAPVAHAAHLAGYAYGFLLCALLVAVRIVKSDEHDLLYLLRQGRRRREYRRVLRESEVAQDVASPKSMSIPVLRSSDVDPATQALRSEVLQALRLREFDTACDRFRKLIDTAPETVLPESAQLEMANRLQADGDRERAAVAYRELISHYPRSRQVHEVKVLLASLLIRTLDQPEEARPLLESALPELTSNDHRQLAQRLLDSIGTGS